MKIINRIFLLVAAALVLAQCAKKESPDFDSQEQRSLDTWMAANNPDVQKMDNGMYMEWLESSGEGDLVQDDDWLLLNFRGSDLQGNVFMTRYADEARKEGTFSPYTHYAPFFIKFDGDFRHNFTKGEQTALRMMRKGDKVRLYLPSKLAYKDMNINATYGYLGSTTSELSNKPVIIELSVVDIIKNADRYQMDCVRDYAVNEWGMNESDTILRSVYFQYIHEDTSQDLVKLDSTVWMRYTCTFLDGFPIKSNEYKIAHEVWDDWGTYYDPYNYAPNATVFDEEAITEPGVQALFQKNVIRYNSHFRVIFPAGGAYGVRGKAASSTNPVVFPYTPVIFEIRTYNRTFNPNTDDDYYANESL